MGASKDALRISAVKISGFIPLTLGSALFWTWERFYFFSEPIPTSIAGTSRMLFHLAMIIAALFIAIGARKTPVLQRPATVFCCALLLAVLAALFALLKMNSVLVPDAVMFMANFGMGLLAPVLAIAWGGQQLQARHSLIFVIASTFILAYLFSSALSLLPVSLAIGVATLLLCFSATLYWYCCTNVNQSGAVAVSGAGNLTSGQPAHKLATPPLRYKKQANDLLTLLRDIRTISWREMVIVTIVVLTGHILIVVGYNYEQAQMLPFSLSVVTTGSLGCVIIALLSSWTRRLSVQRIALLLIVFTYILALLCLIVGMGDWGIALPGSLPLLYQFIVWIIAAELASRGLLAPQSSFGVGIALIALVPSLGTLCGTYLSFTFFEDYATLKLFLIAGALFIVFCALLMLAIPGKRPETAAPSPCGLASCQQCPNLLEEAIGRNLDEFAHHHGLSQRETEVFTLLLRGTSTPAIAQELFLTTSTVNTHIKHIYHKLDVRSRQQAADVFSAYTNRDDTLSQPATVYETQAPLSLT
ncbi:MAG: helix-turn-helix transcriptional regulator [Coriobacteriales bacterium]|nr:helix-turn-helix transcriptional regulator [Coriobacteriales bacterium]